MATYDTPIPGVPQYGQAALAAKTAYGNALARINQRRGSLLRSSGFAADINSDSGVVANMRVDGSNKYGQLQQLNRDQASRDEMTRWSGIERGLGAGGGLAAQMRSQGRYEFGREDSDFAQRLTESLSGLQDEQTSAAYSRDRALYEAELEAARMAIQGGDFNPADFSGIDIGGEDPAIASNSASSSKTTPRKTTPAKLTNHRQVEIAAAAAAKRKPSASKTSLVNHRQVEIAAAAAVKKKKGR